MSKTLSRVVQVSGWLEGASFLLLLFVAMPLKYGLDLPQMVSVVGRAHGGLFVLYVGVVMYAFNEADWGWKHLGLGLAASFVPFGPFLFDRHMRRQGLL